jgi:hypothetical protein
LKPWDIIWGATGVIVFIAITTKTDWIQQAIAAVKGQKTGYRYGYAPTFSIRPPDYRPNIGDTSSFGYYYYEDQPGVVSAIPALPYDLRAPHIQTKLPKPPKQPKQPEETYADVKKNIPYSSADLYQPQQQQ